MIAPDVGNRAGCADCGCSQYAGEVGDPCDSCGQPMLSNDEAYARWEAATFRAVPAVDHKTGGGFSHRLRETLFRALWSKCVQPVDGVPSTGCARGAVGIVHKASGGRS